MYLTLQKILKENNVLAAFCVIFLIYFFFYSLYDDLIGQDVYRSILTWKYLYSKEHLSLKDAITPGVLPIIIYGVLHGFTQSVTAISYLYLLIGTVVTMVASKLAYNIGGTLAALTTFLILISNSKSLMFAIKGDSSLFFTLFILISLFLFLYLQSNENVYTCFFLLFLASITDKGTFMVYSLAVVCAVIFWIYKKQNYYILIIISALFSSFISLLINFLSNYVIQQASFVKSMSVSLDMLLAKLTTEQVFNYLMELLTRINNDLTLLVLISSIFGIAYLIKKNHFTPLFTMLFVIFSLILYNLLTYLYNNKEIMESTFYIINVILIIFAGIGISFLFKILRTRRTVLAVSLTSIILIVIGVLNSLNLGSLHKDLLKENESIKSTKVAVEVLRAEEINDKTKVLYSSNKLAQFAVLLNLSTKNFKPIAELKKYDEAFDYQFVIFDKSNYPMNSLSTHLLTHSNQAITWGHKKLESIYHDKNLLIFKST